jgi:hypothetical protein
MGYSFLDILETVAPIGVAMIPGVGIPAAIALSAATKGGITAAKGGGMGEILRDAAIGGATGAAGAGIGGAISKGASKAAAKTAEKAMDVGVQSVIDATPAAIAEGGIEAVPELTQAALDTSTAAVTKAAPKVARFEKIASLTSGALGKDPDKTEKLLKTTKTIGKVASGMDDMAQAVSPPPRFNQHQASIANAPGMDPRYQFGGRRMYGGTKVVGGGYY